MLSRLPLKFEKGDFEYFLGLALGTLLGTALGLVGLFSVLAAIIIVGGFQYYEDAD